MYHNEGKCDDFALILKHALADDDKRSNPHMFAKDEDRIKCFNALSFYFHQLSASETQVDA